jgi:hypothetical protein
MGVLQEKNQSQRQDAVQKLNNPQFDIIVVS